MKNAVCIFAVFIASMKFFSLHAQETGGYTSGYWFYYDIHSENENNHKNKANGLRQKVVTTKTSHHTDKTQVNYDTAGRVQVYKNRNWETRIRYYNEALKQSQLVFKKGKLVESDSFLWDNKVLQSHYKYKKHDRPSYRELYKYDSTYVTEYLFEKFKGGKFKEFRKRIFEYYPDRTYKKITYYKKGKPSYFSVFDCNPAGQNHKIEKDSAYNCIKYDVDSLGNKIKVSITNENKYSRKTIEYFNDKDQRIAQKTFDLKKNRPIWFITYKPGSSWAMTQYIWYKKGKENYRMENTYNENDDCTSWVYYSKGVMKGKTINSYNAKGVIEKSETLDKHNKKTSESIYQYEYY